MTGQNKLRIRRAGQIKRRTSMQEEINQLKLEIAALKAASTIPFDTEQAFRERLRISEFVSTSSLPSGLFTAPLGSITSPTGGGTVDSQARTAIDTIITRLESLGLVSPN